MNYKVFFSAFIAVFIFQSCGTATQFYYTSTADIPQESNSTETVMNVVLNDTDNERFYGIISAVDDGVDEYLLLAPKKLNTQEDDNRLSVFNITYATHLSLESAEEFSESLDIIISRWGNLSNDDGYFYKFSSTPITDIAEIKPNIIAFQPSVAFYFNVTDDGPAGEMIFKSNIFSTGEVLSRSLSFESRREIEDLRSLLDNGLTHFNN